MTPDNIIQLWASLEIAKFLTSEGLRATVESVRNFFSSTSRGQSIPADAQAVFLTDEGIEFVGTLLIISKPILDYIADEIRKAETDYLVCLRGAQNRGERNRCDRDAEIYICETLERAKLRNNGILPAPLDPVWIRYGCA
ncbi:hypothetical protein [Candidatus Nitrospira neomarina]|uniref:Uncharacterized protein n=1 Tax=Candidatus Nitrospira neomarina TaxID=3020899 RepID=A0AA96GHZ4_9BACT|nr:hypothetical protein [Candidatus Nitrospira neomarina]WNM60515.1 hypothetical protein PQG83_12160 [Candidatus Nitrospira neomarina]